MTPRITISPEAALIVSDLKRRFGPLLFHQSGGCCEGSQPMCFQEGDFKIGESDVCLGIIENCPFWMSKDQFEYWKHTQLNMHVTPGRGSSFSLEIPMGIRFMIQSRLFSEEETSDLEPLRTLADFTDQ